MSRVVDGDTLVVTRAGQRQRVRLIGIDTPESVRPETPVECFGPEAAAFATEVLQGREVTLESDPSQGDLDAYDRRLAYVWYSARPGQQTLFNAQAIEAGMAREYTYSEPYQWRDEFIAAQDAAQSSGLGLWGACSP
ncbi:MAG: thermonuclease family protein [Actinomycetales bacterium]